MIHNKKIAITMGDPAGIGAEIIVKSLAALNPNPENIVLVGNRELFAMAGLPEAYDIIDVPCNVLDIKIGRFNSESGKTSFLALEKACELVKENKIQAIVTAPLSKKAINLAGYDYSGQTEIIEKYLGSEDNKAEMLFVADDFRVLLLTRHIALKEIPGLLTGDKIIESILSLNYALVNRFKIKKPRFAICGLNPHSGEDGLIGTEESEIIIPAINELVKKYNIHIEGPFPADTIWLRAAKAVFGKTHQPYDAYIACYHDQGLIPVKLLAMEKAVNVTINLPVIRTSPAHGTAFDIAGKGIADSGSMKHAIELAFGLIELSTCYPENFSSGLNLS